MIYYILRNILWNNEWIDFLPSYIQDSLWQVFQVFLRCIYTFKIYSDNKKIIIKIIIIFLIKVLILGEKLRMILIIQIYHAQFSLDFVAMTGYFMMLVPPLIERIPCKNAF